MAKPNYQFERRQRELAKKRKQEAKRQRKLDNKTDEATGASDDHRETTATAFTAAAGEHSTMPGSPADSLHATRAGGHH